MQDRSLSRIWQFARAPCGAFQAFRTRRHAPGLIPTLATKILVKWL